METKTTKQSTKQVYRCELCDYNTCNKSNFNKHISTRKHQMETGGNPKSTKQKMAKKGQNIVFQKSEKMAKNVFFCFECKKEYFSKSDSGNTRKGGVNIIDASNNISDVSKNTSIESSKIQ